MEKEDGKGNDRKFDRRSSILKFPRAKGSDEDLEEAADENRPPSRRVSFANTNFIKEFANDSARNTIWNTTYEEELKESPMQQAQLETEVNKENAFVQEIAKCFTVGTSGTGRVPFRLLDVETDQQENELSPQDEMRCGNKTVFDDVMEFTMQDVSRMGLNKTFSAAKQAGNGTEMMEITELGERNLEISRVNATCVSDVDLTMPNVVAMPQTEKMEFVAGEESMEISRQDELTKNFSFQNSETNEGVGCPAKTEKIDWKPLEFVNSTKASFAVESFAEGPSLMLNCISPPHMLNLSLQEPSEDVNVKRDSDSLCETSVNEPTSHGTTDGNWSVANDTHALINYRLTIGNKAQSEFSRIAAGDQVSLPHNSKLPLSEFDSSCFDISPNQTQAGPKSRMDYLKDFLELRRRNRPPPRLTQAKYGAQLRVLQAQFDEKMKLFPRQNDVLKVAVAGYHRSLQKADNLVIPDIPPITKELVLGKQEESSSNSLETKSDDLAVSNITSLEGAVRSLYDEVKDKCEKWRFKEHMVLIDWKEGTCTLSICFKWIDLSVQVDEETGTVIRYTKTSKLEAEAHELRFIENLMLKRLEEKRLEAALGPKYDILSFVDYIQLNFEESYKLLEIFGRLRDTNQMKMDKNFRIDFIVTNMPLRIVLEISVDLADVDNVNYDTVRMRELRNLPFVKPIMKSIKNCPKGLSFLPSFCNQVEAHVRKCEEEKKQTTKIL